MEIREDTKSDTLARTQLKIIGRYGDFGLCIYGAYSAFSYSVREGYTGMAYY